VSHLPGLRRAGARVWPRLYLPPPRPQDAPPRSHRTVTRPQTALSAVQWGPALPSTGSARRSGALSVAAAAGNAP